MMAPDYFILQKHISNPKWIFFFLVYSWLIKIITIC